MPFDLKFCVPANISSKGRSECTSYVQEARSGISSAQAIAPPTWSPGRSLHPEEPQHTWTPRLEGGDRLSCSFMKPYMATRLDDYWCWPSHEYFYSIHKNCVLPVKPSVDVSVKMSTKRNVVYVCQNADIIRLFTK